MSCTNSLITKFIVVPEIVKGRLPFDTYNFIGNGFSPLSSVVSVEGAGNYNFKTRDFTLRGGKNVSVITGERTIVPFKLTVSDKGTLASHLEFKFFNDIAERKNSVLIDFTVYYTDSKYRPVIIHRLSACQMKDLVSDSISSDKKALSMTMTFLPLNSVTEVLAVPSGLKDNALNMEINEEILKFARK